MRSLFVLIILAPLAWPTPRPLPAQAIDCAGYDSQIWAQSVYETDPVAYAALDPDGNGLACEALQSGAAPALWTNAIPASAQPADLASIADGDTIQVFVNGAHEPVRLILIDSPETVDPNRPVECFGQESTAYLTWLLSLGGAMYLESDVSDRDQFGRLLRYVWLDFGGGEVYLVNETLVRSGYAAQSTFPPDVKYEAQLREAARFARAHGYGLWSACATDGAGDTNDLSGAHGLAAAPDTAPPPAAAAPAPESMPITDGCDPAYPDACIPSPPPDLDCGDIGPRRFTVVPPDPHNFDGDFDGIGCERD
jgi:micrococcal nuclease